ncbi:MAG: hypothetical protein H5T65_02780 [Chloroflexi bacterium]|nr:hypothetical protein [Chloroflexota bacterium]
MGIMCRWFSEISRNDVALAGGKGANLGDMAQAGLPIPPGFVILSSAYRRVAEALGLGEQIARILSGLDYLESGHLQEVEHRVRALFADIPIPDDLRDEIVAHYRALGPDAAVAVRSSATAEDLAGASFAGQQETFLNVVGEDQLLRAVRGCWSSLFTSQAIFYRHQKGFEHSEVSMAVVVQKMINSEKSGVTFTVDPVMRNHFQMTIEAVWGLGEGIVSGTITPDHYKVDRETYEIVYEFVPEKQIMVCRDGDCGVITLQVPPDKAAAKVLTLDELRQLVDLGNKVERHFGCPQDIEWASEGGTIYLLQSRPITCL